MLSSTREDCAWQFLQFPPRLPSCCRAAKALGTCPPAPPCVCEPGVHVTRVPDSPRASRRTELLQNQVQWWDGGGCRTRAVNNGPTVGPRLFLNWVLSRRIGRHT